MLDPWQGRARGTLHFNANREPGPSDRRDPLQPHKPVVQACAGLHMASSMETGTPSANHLLTLNSTQREAQRTLVPQHHAFCVRRIEREQSQRSIRVVMTRGVAGFNGGALRSARLAARCEEHGHSLTAACLADKVGTSKALILSYEHGRSSPSPQRLAQLAAAVGVSAGSLMTKENQLSDLRVASGLTVHALAGRLGIAVNTYRRIEREGVLPKRRPGVMWDLSDVLRLDYTRLRTALNRIPAVQQRWRATATVLRIADKQAVSPGPFTPIEDTSSEAQMLAMLFKARAAVVSQLVNIHLSQLRQLASQRAQAQTRIDFSMNNRWNSHYEADVDSLGQEIEQAREHGPELLEQYLVRPMSQQCWQTLAVLYLTGPGGLEPSQLNAATVAILERSFNYYLIERSLTGISLSVPGVLFFTDTLPYYRAIYPVQGVIRPDSQHYGWPSMAPRTIPPRRRLRTAHVLGHDPHSYWNDIPRRYVERR